MVVANGAEEGKVVEDGDVVDETWVESSVGVYMASAADEWSGVLAGGEVFDEVAGVVGVVGGGDESGLDGCRSPVGVSFAEEGGDAGDVRTGHGSAGDDVEENAAGIDVEVGGGGYGGPAGEDVDTGSDDVGFEDLRRAEVGAAAGEGGDLRGRRRGAYDGAAEGDGGGRGVGGSNVGSDDVSGLLADHGGRDEVGVSEELLAVIGGVGEDHAGTAGELNGAALFDSSVDAAIA